MLSGAFNKNQESQPQLYSISVEEFKVPPTEIKPYKPGDKINRDNFINFLILSFAISMGQPRVQILFMRWLKLKFGFDWLTVFYNLNYAGGWEILSDGEKGKFLEQFRKVGKHTKGQNFASENDIGSEIKQLGTTQTQGSEDEKKIANINTFTEFSELAHKEVIRIREEKAR